MSNSFTPWIGKGEILEPKNSSHFLGGSPQYFAASAVVNSRGSTFEQEERIAMHNELLGSQQAKPRIPIPFVENGLNQLAYSFRQTIDYEEMILNRFRLDCDLMRSRHRLDRIEDPVRLAALRALRLYRPGRAGGLIRYLALTTKLPIDDARRALVHALDDRANDRRRMDVRDQEFFGEILALDTV